MAPTGTTDMYSEWTSLVQKIEKDRMNNASVLAIFPDGVGKEVAASVVKSLVHSPSSHSVVPSSLTSDDQVKWTMEVVGFGLTLPFTEYEIIRDCVNVECDWLTALTTPKTNVPAPVAEDPNFYARRIFLHLYYLFVPRPTPAKSRPLSGGSSAAVAATPSSQQRQDLIKHQAVLCHRALRTLQTLATESVVMDNATWEALLCFLLAANDALLSPPTVKNDIGDQLGERIVSVLYDVWLLSCARSFPSPSLWKTLKELCRFWRHHSCVVDQWNKTVSKLTSRVLTILYGPTFPEFKRLDEVEDRIILTELSNECLVQAWFRFLHVLSDPTDLSKPEVIADAPKFIQSAITGKLGPKDPIHHPCLQKLPIIFFNAIKSISNIADAFLGIYDSIQDQTHRDFIHNSSAVAPLHNPLADAPKPWLVTPTTPPAQRKAYRGSNPSAAKKTERFSKNVLTARTTSLASLAHGTHSHHSHGSPGDSQSASLPAGAVDRGASYFPIRATCNSVFHLLGCWLFEAALVGCHLHPSHENMKNSATRRTPSFLDQSGTTSRIDEGSEAADGQSTPDGASIKLSKSGYEAGRAEAIASICRILCSLKTKEDILPTYLSRSYLILYYALQLEQDPSGAVLSSMLISGSDLLRSDLDGIFILIPHFLSALELILPESNPRFKGSEMISHTELRRSAIHLLISMLCLPLHFRDLPLNDITVTANVDGDFHSLSLGDRDSTETFRSLKLKLMNLIIQALHTETDSINIHMLLGALLIVVQDSAFFELNSSAATSGEEKETISASQPSRIASKQKTPSASSEPMQQFDSDFMNANLEIQEDKRPPIVVSSPPLTRSSPSRPQMESQFSDPGDTATEFFGRAIKVIQAKLNKSWKSDLSMSLSALEVLCGLSKVSLILRENTLESNELIRVYKVVVKFVCAYIEEQCSRPPQNHSRDLHSMIVAAYQCLSFWLIDHPELLEDESILMNVFETIELGISGAKSKVGEKDAGIFKANKELRPASMRVREAAENVLSILMDQTGSFPSPCGPESLSSLLDEGMLLKQCFEEFSVSDARESAMKQFRYFVIDNSFIVALFEQPLANEQDPLPTVTVLLRSCRGKHVWTMQLRHLPRSMRNKSRGSRANAVVTRPLPDETPSDFQLKPQRWWPELVDHIPEVKADKSIPTLEEVLKETNSVAEHDAFVKLVQSQAAFEDSVAKVYEDETAAVRASSSSFLDPSLECRPPAACHEFQTARLFLSHFGFLNIDKLNENSSSPKVVAIDSRATGFSSDIEQLDSLPSRMVDTAFVFYVKSGQRNAEEILNNANNSEDIHPFFYQLLNSLGWPVDILKHAGWTGNVLSSWCVLESNPFSSEMSVLPNLKPELYDGLEKVLYYGDINSEIAFITPSLHSSDVIRASLARRPSLVEALDAISLESGVSRSSLSTISSTKSELPAISEPGSSDFEDRSRRSSSGEGSAKTSGANSNAAGKKSKFFTSKQDRHRTEFSQDSAIKTPHRPTQSAIGTTHSFESYASENKTLKQRPLSLELEQKPTESSSQGPTAASRGYREIVSPSPVGSATAETPRGRRMGRQMITAAQELKVMIVWLESLEDRAHFPSSELVNYHCITGTEPYVTRRRSSRPGVDDAQGVSMDLNLFILFVHPLQNGLFRIFLQSPPSRSAMAVPLVDGVVISRRLLGVAVRQTVVNICQRKRLEDADANQPPAVKRRYKIQEIMNKYHDQMGDPEFLTALFQEME